MLDTRVGVRRDDFTAEVSGDDLVPGDVVLLEAGDDDYPADGHFLFAHPVAVDESSLTAEIGHRGQGRGLQPGHTMASAS